MAIFKIIIWVAEIIGLFKMYEKMNEKKWYAIIPIYDEYVLFKDTYNTKAFWIYTICDLAGTLVLQDDEPSGIAILIGLILLIPIIVIQVRFAKNFAAAFGGKKSFAILTFFFPAAMYIYTGYSNDVNYLGNMSK